MSEQLALPVIVAGVRTATVWVVGIATLSTPVGAPSLGNYIFSGLATRNDNIGRHLMFHFQTTVIGVFPERLHPHRPRQRGWPPARRAGDRLGLRAVGPVPAEPVGERAVG